MSKIAVSVVIPTHLRSASLERALESLARQDLDRASFEILVVSNLDDRRAKALVDDARERGLSARHLVAGKIGVNRARNLGLSESRGDVVLFLDDDCRLVRPDHLSRLVRRYSEEPEIALRGGLYRDAMGAPSASRDYNAVVNAWILSRAPGLGPLVGGNFSVRRSAVGDARFDDAIAYGGSEIGFQRTIVENGGRARLDHDLVVEHECDVSRLTLFRKAWKQGRRHESGVRVSPLESIAALASNEASHLENAKRVAFGIVFGSVSRLGWLSARVEDRFGSGRFDRVSQESHETVLREDSHSGTEIG